MTDQTEIVLEGFPRSANTYAVNAFREMQDREPKIAHHLHIPMQIEEGLRRGIAVCLLIRDPVEAVTSLALRSDGMGSARGYLEDYIRFHRHVAQFKDRMVVADFPIVTNSLHRVIEKINEVHATDFRAVPVEDELRERVVKIIRSMSSSAGMKETQIALPSESKGKQRGELAGTLDPERVEEARYWYRTCLASRYRVLNDAGESVIPASLPDPEGRP